MSTPTVIDTKDSIPTAAIAAPKIPEKIYEIINAIPKIITDRSVDFIPTDRPCVIVIAEPSLEAEAICLVGL